MQKNWFFILGFLIYIVLSIVDKLIYRIPDYIYIPVAILGIIFVILGIIHEKKGSK